MTNVSTVAHQRERVALRPQLEKNLAVYALAGAAGVGMMFSPSAQGAVVYTSVKSIGSPGSTIPIDLNHDGVTDFTLKDTYLKTGVYDQHASVAMDLPGSGDFLAIDPADEAQAFNAGAQIGPALRFNKFEHSYRLALAAVTYSGLSYKDGSFLNQSNKFLGLKFAIGGATHYAWARVSTKLVGSEIYVELLDYAYQSTANKPIYAGQGIPTTGTLGALAFGAEVSQQVAK